MVSDAAIYLYKHTDIHTTRVEIYHHETYHRVLLPPACLHSLFEDDTQTSSSMMMMMMLYSKSTNCIYVAHVYRSVYTCIETFHTKKSDFFSCFSKTHGFWPKFGVEPPEREMYTEISIK